jgi:hypothetical protein
MGKIYNVILNSNFGTGALTNNKSYCVNWSNIPDDKKLKLTWSFTSSSNFAYNPGLINYVFCDIGQPEQIFATNNSLRNARYDCLGSMKLTASTGKYAIFACDTRANPPLFLDKRPSNNILTITIVTGNIIQTQPAINPDNYTLILSFEEL